MFKTRCILDWYDKYATQFPVRLFEYERQLIENGMFEAYNRWVYQDAADPSGFQDWVKAHQQQYDAYNDFARGRVFKIPKGQYYPPEGQ